MNLKRIVVGLDGSAESASALEWAADVASLTEARITAVTVFDAGPFMAWGIGPVYLPDFEQLRAGLREDLVSWCEPLRSRGIAHDAVLRQGSAAIELLKEADKQSADLVVLGTRGRGGIGELLLGSVAHHVTQHSKHPVLIVPRLAVAATAQAMTPALTAG